MVQKNNVLLTRWDNAPHHRELSNFPHHVYKKNDVFESEEMSIDAVLKELEKMMTLIFVLTCLKMTSSLFYAFFRGLSRALRSDVVFNYLTNLYTKIYIT